MRNQYRAPAGHRPYIPRTGNHGGPLAGLCAVIILGGMVLLSLLALDRVASAPAAHPALPITWTSSTIRTHKPWRRRWDGEWRVHDHGRD